MVFRKKAVEPADPSPSVDLSTIVRAASEQALTDCGNFRLSELLSLPDNLRFLRAFCVADGCFELALFVLDAQHACSAPVPSVCDTLARKTCRKWDRRGGPVEAAFASAGDGAPTERLGAAEATVLRQLRADVLPRFLASSHFSALVRERLRCWEPPSPSELHVCAELGVGMTSAVLLARRGEAGARRAVKVIDKRATLKAGLVGALWRERDALRACSHAWIVGLAYTMQDEHWCYLFTTWAPGGDAYALTRQKGALPLGRCRALIAQVAIALGHLHERGLLHRDVKPDNVLLTSSGDAMLADLGAACSAAHTAPANAARRRRRRSLPGTHGYRAPELFDATYGEEVDWWGVGLLVWELLTGRQPYRGRSSDESRALLRGAPPELHGDSVGELLDVSADAVALVQALLSRDVAARRRAGELATLRAHPFFAGMAWPEAPPAAARAAADDASLAPEKRLAGAPTLDRASEFVDELRRTAAARRGERLSEAQQQLFRGFEWTNPNVLLELDGDVSG